MTQESRQIKGKLKYKLSSVASKFEETVCDCFQDCVYQLIIWSEDDMVCVKGIMSDINGNIKPYLMEYDPEKEVFTYFNKYVVKGFYDSKSKTVFTKAFKEFINGVTDMKDLVHKVVIDISISDTYSDIRLCGSDKEEGCVDLFLLSHSSKDKEEWGLF